MEVTRHNFAEALPRVKQALADCQFFAIDCEMTGLFVDDRSGNYLDEIDDRYNETLASSRAFVINQFGLSAFVWEGGAYRPRTFTFSVFPRPGEGAADKRFLCQASSLAFLASCGFDFNKAIYDGISYTTVAARDAALAAVDRPPRERSEVLVTKPEDTAFVAQLVEEVRAWLQGGGGSDSGAGGGGEAGAPTLELPAVNAYQRLLQYQELRRPQFGVADPPGFYVERAPDAEGRPRLVLTRASAEQVAAWEAAQRDARIAAIHEAAGFAAVMEAMRDSGKPCVGHNLSFDLAYSLHSFAQELPGSWDEYQALVGAWFPGGVFDTKYLSGRLPELFEDTSLGVIHDGMLKGQLSEKLDAYLAQQAAGTGGAPAQLPAVKHAEGYERYEGAETAKYAHEAGYDAYMTGAAFGCLARLYEAAAAGAGGQTAPPPGQQPGLGAVGDFCWRMNISRSDMPYAALQGEAPALDRAHVFWVAGWEPSQRVFGGDLVKRLADSGLGRVRVTMVDGGASALVELSDPEAVPGALDVLRERFATWTVREWAAYSEKRREERAAAAAAAAEQRAAAAARRNGNKRPRVEMEGAAPAVGASGGDIDSDGGWMQRCTIQ